jgi:hypothetical protein
MSGLVEQASRSAPAVTAMVRVLLGILASRKVLNLL